MIRTLAVIITLALSVFLPGRQVNAQTRTGPVNNLDSILYDEEDGRLSFPSFVYAEPVRDEIYVIDGKSRIIIYTSDLFALFTLDKRKGIEAPQGLTLDAEGRLYVAQAKSVSNPRPRISVFNACLKWERDIYMQGFEGSDSFVPFRLAIDKNGNIYVAATYFPGVLVLDEKGGLTEIITPEENGRKVKLTSVTLDREGKIYLVSEEEGRVYVYDKDRKFLFKFGVKGGSSAKLSRPLAVGIDNRNGLMYVVDYMRHTVNIYDRGGEYLAEFGGLGWGKGWFQYPREISVDRKGRILVADTFNNRVEVYELRQKPMDKD